MRAKAKMKVHKIVIEYMDDEFVIDHVDIPFFYLFRFCAMVTNIHVFSISHLKNLT
jgi:hypothetical protein